MSRKKFKISFGNAPKSSDYFQDFFSICFCKIGQVHSNLPAMQLWVTIHMSLPPRVGRNTWETCGHRNCNSVIALGSCLGAMVASKSTTQRSWNRNVHK